MMSNTTSRRQFMVKAAATTAGLSAIALATSPAHAEQGNMERALNSLYTALQALREAPPNKGGHKANAVNLIEQAIAEVQAGINFADEHGGN